MRIWVWQIISGSMKVGKVWEILVNSSFLVSCEGQPGRGGEMAIQCDSCSIALQGSLCLHVWVPECVG